MRRRGHHDLQPRRAEEPGFGVLRVIRPRVAQPAPGHAHHHRHFPAPAIPDLRGVVDELVEPGGDEVVELHLANRPQAGERRTHARAKHRAFRQRRIQDAIAIVLQERAQHQERVAILPADILAKDKDAIDQRPARHPRRASRLPGMWCPSCRRAVQPRPSARRRDAIGTPRARPDRALPLAGGSPGHRETHPS